MKKLQTEKNENYKKLITLKKFRKKKKKLKGKGNNETIVKTEINENYRNLITWENL